MRWYEELQLLPEEMRRTVKSHLFKSDSWLSRSMACTAIDSALQKGLSAYAARQADIQCGLAHQVSTLWLKTAKAAIAGLDSDSADGSDAVCTTICNGLAAVLPVYRVCPLTHVDTTLTSDFDADADIDAALHDTDNDDVSSDDKGVQELEESEAVIAFMELDTLE